MQLKNTLTHYGAVTKSFHWIMAILIIFMLCLGLYMGGEQDLTWKLQLYGLHKSLGVLILTLAVLRILWHFYSKKPGFAEGVKPWEKLAARALHICLYLAMIGMPLSGWALSSAAGRPVSFFGLFTLPNLIAPDETLRDFLGETHETIAWLLIAALCVHVGAALKHHFITKDATLRRMLPFMSDR